MRKTTRPIDQHEGYSPARRRFLKYGAMGALGLAAAARRGFSALEGGPLPGFGAGSSAPGAGASALGLPAAAKSRVVLVRHPAVVDASGKVQAPLLQSILDKAITTFSGKSTVADAWRQYVSPDDVVGLKINTLGLQEVKGTDYTRHFPAFAEALAAGLRTAGVKDANIVVWDRSEEEMESAGLTIQKDTGRMRFIANKSGMMSSGNYAPATYPVGDRSSRVSAILADTCTVFFNVPVPKTHGKSLFTCALKNHYGSIDNPSSFHADGCSNPGIAEVNAIPIIRKKEKLVVSDALLIVPESGPRWRRSFIRPFGGVIVGTDPVAVDAVALKVIDDARAAEGMERIAPQVKHLPLAEALGLGNSRLENIDLVSLTLG
jgi:uncharacterized protein (DUF362 family)